MCGHGSPVHTEGLGRVPRAQAEASRVEEGFDDGDSVLLGELSEDGLKPIKPEATRRERPIAPALEDLRASDPWTAILATVRLPRLGECARDAVPELLRIASMSPEFGMRQAAVAALADIAPDDPSAKAAVLQALNDTDPFVRREALQAMTKIKELSPSDLARIKDMENDPHEDVRDWSEIALRNIRLRDEAAGSHPSGF